MSWIYLKEYHLESKTWVIRDCQLYKLVIFRRKTREGVRFCQQKQKMLSSRRSKLQWLSKWRLSFSTFLKSLSFKIMMFCYFAVCFTYLLNNNNSRGSRSLQDIFGGTLTRQPVLHTHYTIWPNISLHIEACNSATGVYIGGICVAYSILFAICPKTQHIAGWFWARKSLKKS